MKQEAIVQAVGTILKERSDLQDIQSQALMKSIREIVVTLRKEMNEKRVIPAPEVQVKNEVNPTPVQVDSPVAVQVDMTPIAEALNGLRDILTQTAQMQATTMTALIEALQRPVLVTIEPAQISVEAPVVNVASPVVNMPEIPPAQITVNVPEKKASSFVVRHADGTETQIQRT